jgi:hypothetical protein
LKAWSVLDQRKLATHENTRLLGYGNVHAEASVKSPRLNEINKPIRHSLIDNGWKIRLDDASSDASLHK